MKMRLKLCHRNMYNIQIHIIFCVLHVMYTMYVSCGISSWFFLSNVQCNIRYYETRDTHELKKNVERKLKT